MRCAASGRISQANRAIKRPQYTVIADLHQAKPASFQRNGCQMGKGGA